MVGEVKKELRNIADKIDLLAQAAYEKGRKAACTEIAEKLRNENIDAGLIEKIIGVKTGAPLPAKNTSDFEEFTKKYTENYKIEVTLNIRKEQEQRPFLKSPLTRHLHSPVQELSRFLVVEIGNHPVEQVYQF